MGIDGEKIAGYDTAVTTHVEVGIRILAGEADAGVATKAIARPMGLDFVQLTQERFDMLIPRARFSSRGIQKLLDVIGAKEFRGRVESLDGYDLSESGRILTLNS